MNTIDEKCVAKKAPGTVISDAVWAESLAKIEFDEARPVRPLPPLVQALVETTNKSINIEVCAFAFIGDGANISQENPITVSWDWDKAIKPNPRPRFYISYNSAEESSKKFTAYKVTFTICLPLETKFAPTIETIVWDEDPVASRGTETAVQK